MHRTLRYRARSFGVETNLGDPDENNGPLHNLETLKAPDLSPSVNMSNCTSVVSSEKQPNQDLDGVDRQEWDSKRIDRGERSTYLNWIPDNTWEEYDIPSELQYVQVGAPSEVSTIIRESLEYCQATKASLNDRLADSQFHLDAAIAYQAGSTSSRDRSFGRTGFCESTASTSEASSSVSQSTSNRDSAASAITIDSNQDAAIMGKEPSANTGNSVAAPPVSDMKQKFLKFLKSSVCGRLGLEEALKPLSVECASCYDVVVYAEAINLRCQHGYCSSCFSKLVSAAIEHESYFPPKCCLQQIPVKFMRAGLPGEELAAYKLKAKEYAIPLDTRWFCASPECGKWFDRRRSRSRKDIVTCPHCQVKICQGCRRLSHAPGEACPQDREFEATFEMANLHGWRRCYKCQALVELISGCHHITCMCKAEFCYTCSAKWGNCKCTDYDERRRQLELRERQLTRCEGMDRNVTLPPYYNGAWEHQDREQQLQEAWERANLERQRFERERRAAEEVRQIQLMETGRRQAIEYHYESLRNILVEVDKTQRLSMWDRQTKELANSTKSRSERISALSVELQIFIDRHVAQSRHRAAQALAALNRTRAQVLDEITKRHNVDTIQYVHSIDPTLPIHENYSVALRALQSTQEAKISNLMATFAREAKELEKAAMRTCLLPTDQLSLSMHYLQLVLKKEKKELEQEISAIRKKHLAEWKWLSIVKAKRAELLQEKKSQLLAKGGDVRSSIQMPSAFGADVAARWANRTRLNIEEIGHAPPARSPTILSAQRSIAHLYI